MTKTRLVMVVSAVLGLLVAGVARPPAPVSAGDAQGAVVGGQPADAGEHPFHVAVVLNPDWFGGDPLVNQICGGTLVAPDVVLTAGHCVDTDMPGELLPVYGILAGTEDIGDATTEDLILVRSVAMHPGYWTDAGDDLALAVLAEPVPGATTIALPDATQEALWAPGAPATVLGWGDTSATVPRYPTTLQEGEVQVVDDQTCFDQYRVGARILLDMDRSLCAAAPGVDACYGDSGGALVADDGGEAVQIGIVQGGIGCAAPDYPGIYVRLSAYAQQLRTLIDEPFSDVPLAHAFAWEIATIASEGIAQGYDDGTFRPSRPVSRAAMAAYLYRMAGSPTPTPPATPTFRDVGSAHPFSTEIEWLAAEGITTGFADGRFRPAASVSRAATAAYLHRLAGRPHTDPFPPFDDVGPSHPFAAPIAWAAEQGIMYGSYAPDGSVRFRPAAPTSRQAMAAFLSRYLARGL